MTVPIHRGVTRIGSRLLVAVGVIFGVGAVLTGVADAHDFHIEVTRPQCVDGAKHAEAHVFNDWSTTLVFTSATLSASTVTVQPGNYGTIKRVAPGSKVGLDSIDTVTGHWADGVTASHGYQINWGSDVCEGSPTTPAPTTTVPQCPPGQFYSTVPPVGCYDTTPSVPTTPPATNPPEVGPCVTAPQPGQPGYDACGDCSPPEICAGYQSSTTTTVAAPPVASTVRPAPPKPKTPLPVTGSSSTTVIAAALGAIAIGAIVLFTARRPKES